MAWETLKLKLPKQELDDSGAIHNHMSALKSSLAVPLEGAGLPSALRVMIRKTGVEQRLAPSLVPRPMG